MSLAAYCLKPLSAKLILPFVIKKHKASRLHYDFRLEYAGVLKSWVLPEGPCLDSSVVREALLVDDHSVTYRDSERMIPAGLRGAGPVMVWDYGYWLTDQDVDQAFSAGLIKFELRGKRLRGSWSLIRKSIGGSNKEEHWALSKEPDAEARSLLKGDILVEQHNSVLTGRTLDEIARNLPPFPPSQSKIRRRHPQQRLLFSNDLKPELVAPYNPAAFCATPYVD